MGPANFAAEWQDACNSHDLERIMAHYDADIVFRSRKGVQATETLWFNPKGIVTRAAACHKR